MVNLLLLYKAYESLRQNDPLISIISQIDNKDLPIIPIVLWMCVCVCVTGLYISFFNY